MGRSRLPGHATTLTCLHGLWRLHAHDNLLAALCAAVAELVARNHNEARG